MKTLRLTVSYLLVLSMLLLTIPMTSQFVVSARQQHVKREVAAFQAQGSLKLKTEVRTGSSVSLRVRQLLSRKKAFARAYKDMVSRGAKPAFEEHGFTILGVDLNKTVSYKKSAFTLQDISDGDYEMSFFPFDDGDNSTWEGIIYVRGQYDEATYSLKIDDMQEDLSQAGIYQEVYYPSDGGAPRDCMNSPCPIQGPVSRSGHAVRQASFSNHPSAVTLKPQQSRFRTWLGCAASGCITAAIGCRYSGPGYFWCLGGWCGGSLLGCAIGVLIAG
jgi:hypothetical protein